MDEQRTTSCNCPRPKVPAGVEGQLPEPLALLLGTAWFLPEALRPLAETDAEIFEGPL